MQIRPQTKTPDLSVETVRHGSWTLSSQKPENFTLLVFYRGPH